MKKMIKHVPLLHEYRNLPTIMKKNRTCTFEMLTAHGKQCSIPIDDGLFLKNSSRSGRSKCLACVWFTPTSFMTTLQWRHNERDGVSNHQPNDCLLKNLFGRRSKKTPKLRNTGPCVGNSPVSGEFPTQRASNAENVSIWWRQHGMLYTWATGNRYFRFAWVFEHLT